MKNPTTKKKSIDVQINNQEVQTNPKNDAQQTAATTKSVESIKKKTGRLKGKRGQRSKNVQLIKSTNPPDAIPLDSLNDDGKSTSVMKSKDALINQKSSDHLIINDINKRPKTVVHKLKRIKKTKTTVNQRINSESSNVDYKSIDEDSNLLSYESIYSFTEQDLVRQLNSFVNTLNPIEIVLEWDSDRVSDFVSILPECLEYAPKFKEQNVDGESFLLLTQNDLINILEIKLYASLKIYDVICLIRKNLLKLV